MEKIQDLEQSTARVSTNSFNRVIPIMLVQFSVVESSPVVVFVVFLLENVFS